MPYSGNLLGGCCGRDIKCGRTEDIATIYISRTDRVSHIRRFPLCKLPETRQKAQPRLDMDLSQIKSVLVFPDCRHTQRRIVALRDSALEIATPTLCGRLQLEHVAMAQSAPVHFAAPSYPFRASTGNPWKPEIPCRCDSRIRCNCVIWPTMSTASRASMISGHSQRNGCDICAIPACAAPSGGRERVSFRYIAFEAFTTNKRQEL